MSTIEEKLVELEKQCLERSKNSYAYLSGVYCGMIKTLAYNEESTDEIEFMVDRLSAVSG